MLKTLPHVEKRISAHQLYKELETGDLLLISSYYPPMHKEFLFSYIIRAFMGNEWNHVAIIIKYGDVPYIFDCCPYNEDYVHYDWTYNPHKESGYVKVDEYIRRHPGYIGFRKLKHNGINVNIDQLSKISEEYNKNMSFSKQMEWRVLKGFFVKKSIPQKHHITTCVEQVAAIYQEGLGIGHDDFFIGMTMKPFITLTSPLFGPIVHIDPGPKCPTWISNLML
jgi:hypothetical protein